MKAAIQKKAFQKVLKTLGAVRATLNNEERQALDALIGAEEVEGHAMRGTKMLNPRNAFKKNEVEGHAMKVQKQVVQRASANKAEVEGHRLLNKSVVKKASVKKLSIRVSFDPATEEYKIN